MSSGRIVKFRCPKKPGVEGTWVPNWDYILFTFAAVALSTFLLWYTEVPQVRTGLLRKA